MQRNIPMDQEDSHRQYNEAASSFYQSCLEIRQRQDTHPSQVSIALTRRNIFPLFRHFPYRIETLCRFSKA
jgi:hypothetical protein